MVCCHMTLHTTDALAIRQSAALHKLRTARELIDSLFFSTGDFISDTPGLATALDKLERIEKAWQSEHLLYLEEQCRTK